MSRGQRLGLIALAVAVAALAFVIARPDDEDEKRSPAAGTTERAPSRTPQEPTATTDPRPEERIVLRAHGPTGGVRRVEAKKGDFVRLVVESDAADEIHLHGYDVTRKVGPAEPARFSFRADVEGIFELESHEAEHEGGDPLIARLVVEPS